MVARVAGLARATQRGGGGRAAVELSNRYSVWRGRRGARGGEYSYHEASVGYGPDCMGTVPVFLAGGCIKVGASIFALRGQQGGSQARESSQGECSGADRWDGDGADHAAG